MYYITVGELLCKLKELPEDMEISSISRGYYGERQYFTINDLSGNTLKEIDLNRRDNII